MLIWFGSSKVKDQLNAIFNTYIKKFNYNHTCSSSGMSQFTITHTIQQYEYNF